MTNEAKDQVPEWAMERARATLDTYLRTPISPDEAIARALLAAERRGIERAAKVADARATKAREVSVIAKETGDSSGYARENEASFEAAFIAAAIRQLGESP